MRRTVGGSGGRADAVLVRQLAAVLLLSLAVRGAAEEPQPAQPAQLEVPADHNPSSLRY